ncbi:hypothetical protein [Candidatus Binatus sp.]|uniref:hypothetical protein n=1 Tax=Candidatus Binatus sp. TaxID=2811406 RepID=UPI003C669605
MERNHMRRFLPLALAGLFCAFTVAQMTRPLSTIALCRRAGMASRHQRLAPHTIEEVGSQAIDIAAASGHLTFLLPAVDPDRDPDVAIAPDEPDVTEWTSEQLVHRRNPPRSLDDGK